MKRAISLLGVAAVAAACTPSAGGAAARPPAATPASLAADAELAPTPFTADQIRQATRQGRSYRFLVEVPGKPSIEHTLTFVSVDAQGAELAATGEPKKRVTWEDLRKHAEFPRSRVTRTEERVTVPAGTFDCVTYSVRGAGKDDAVGKFYFAKTLPGAPVLFFTEKPAAAPAGAGAAGVRLMTSTLVEHRAGD